MNLKSYFIALLTWRKQIDPLVNANYFVIAPDLRGYNKSDKPLAVDAYSMDILVEDIFGLLTHYNRDQVVVISNHIII